MAESRVDITQRQLLSWVFRRNLKWQSILMAIVVVTVAARIVPLEMQKRIVNDAIMAQRSDRLFFYCSVYLVSFLTAGGLKYLINALQNLIGQRTLARMRNALFSHLIRLPSGREPW
jgi:ABC-type multidrug transport system fused ATPase/permease subunit